MYEHMGRQATDKISGFAGTVTAFSESISGANQVLLTGKSKGGKTECPNLWFDEARLTFSGKAGRLDSAKAAGAGPAGPVR